MKRALLLVVVANELRGLATVTALLWPLFAGAGS